LNLSIRGGSLLRPYRIGNVNDSMDMIRHDYECIRFDALEVFRQFTPYQLGLQTIWIELHFASDNVSKSADTLVRHNRDEICSDLCVVIVWQS